MNVLVTGARAPIAADMAKALSLSGHKVWVTDSLRAPVGAGSPFIQGLRRLPSPRFEFRGFAAGLKTVCADFAIDAIIPTSEEVFWLAGAVHALPPSVSVRTSPLSVLAKLHHKGVFAKLASRLGYGAAENFEISRASDFDRLGDPSRFVVKPVYSRFASRTLIGPKPRDLARLHPSAAEPWLAQTRVSGRELCAYNVAEAGKLLLHVTYEPLFRIGVGASVYFSPLEHAGMRAMSERIVAETNFTGQISFDAIETDRGLVALECNPRGTSGVHLAAQQPSALAAALLGRQPGANESFQPSPRLLLIPLLLNHPGLLFNAEHRRALCFAKDALHAAGVPLSAQAKALLEMSWRAVRAGMSLPRISTADIEWNGEPIGE